MTENSDAPLGFGLPDGHATLITGARRGIGLACARAFLAAGSRVAFADIDMDDLLQARESLDPAGEASSVHVADLTDPESPRKLVAEVVAEHGRVDALVNAAALLEVAPALELDPQAWDQVFAVNARGSFLMAREAARQFIAADRPGRIVLFSSIIAKTARPDSIAYCASKAAVSQICRCLALELGPHDITVNAVMPGSTATEMLLNGQLGNDPKAIENVITGDTSKWRLGIPLGRMATPADPAAAALFLASEGARHISGTELVVDGGQSVV